VFGLFKIALDIHAAEETAHRTVAYYRVLPSSCGVYGVPAAILEYTVAHERPFDTVTAAAATGLDAVIRALKSTGEFKSLAQPNLVTREGEDASFLAGGEFPFPTIQGGGAGLQGITIEWREFGIRLNFTPTITNAGNIRLRVAPEVSSLDFANGLTFQGFQIPALLSRKVDTDVELAPGQTLAIGGLLDNNLLQDVDKIPILGDIPILGFFFRSTEARQDRTELLVLVTPHILDTDNLPEYVLPTGDPNTADWDWDAHIRRWIEDRSRGGTGGG
jgi:pilus assembly protein CpaC